MLHSAEVRWFIPTSLPDGVRHWFTAGDPQPDLEPGRGDEYLLFPNSDMVGVKLRQGKLEVKALVHPPRPVSVVAGVNGRTDQWVKWSFEDEGLKALDAGLRQSGCWVKVVKERYLRKFSADAGQVAEVPAKQKPFPGLGCNVELTSIEVEAETRRWFSLGFEAFGPPGATPKILDETLGQFFIGRGPAPGVSLNVLASFSYPTWLATFA
jgi:hypothetical protein